MSGYSDGVLAYLYLTGELCYDVFKTTPIEILEDLADQL